MGSVICSNYSCFPWKTKATIHKQNLLHPSGELGLSRTTVTAQYDHGEERSSSETAKKLSGLNRRSLLLSGVPVISTLSALALPEQGMAVVKQGLLAGRIPGLSEPDEQDRLENVPETR